MMLPCRFFRIAIINLLLVLLFVLQRTLNLVDIVALYSDTLKQEAVAAPPAFALTTNDTFKRDTETESCCTCPTAPHCKARRNFTSTSSQGPPHPNFDGKLWYFTMGSANYIWALEHFVRGLMQVGVNEDSIGLVCIDDECVEHFQTNWKGIRLESFGPDRIEGTGCQANQKVSDTRCKVSMGKIDTVLQVLKSNDAIFFFDADVLFFKHPYKAMQVSNPNLPLYVQRDGGKNNFGVFLAFPNPFTRSLFEYMQVEFHQTQAFDQGIFNDYLKVQKYNLVENNATDCRGICGDPYDYERLRIQEYINLMTGRYNEKLREEHILSHATCVEGGVLPQIAMKTILGNSANSSYYRDYKTVAVDMAFNSSMEEWIDRSMRVLVYVAKHTGRAIRIQSSVTSRMIFRMNWFRLVSANYIVGELGVDMVEDTYYERAQEWFGRPPPVVVNVSLGDVDEAISQLHNIVSSSDERARYVEADELVFHVSELVTLDGDSVGGLAGAELGYRDGKWSRPFSCHNIEREIAGCVQICDGGHF